MNGPAGSSPREFGLAVLVGLVFGAVARLCRLPVPAPPAWSAVAAIAAVLGGYLLAGRWLG